MDQNKISDIDKVIIQLFSKRWVGQSVTNSLEAMKAQLYKNLNDQIKGYWSGSTAYSIMIDGGFLIDQKREDGKSTSKKLTAFGEIFMNNYKAEASSKH